MNFRWPHIDLCAAQIFLCSTVRMPPRVVVSDRATDERAADLKKGMRKVRVPE